MKKFFQTQIAHQIFVFMCLIFELKILYAEFYVSIIEIPDPLIL